MRRSLAISNFRLFSDLDCQLFDLRNQLGMLRDDQGLQFGGIECFQVGKNASRVIHRGEYTAVVLQLD